jgi:hypothetical protein
MSKRPATQKQLEALAKGRAKRAENRERIKNMTEKEKLAYKEKVRAERRAKEEDRLKNPRSQRDKLNVLYDYIVKEKLNNSSIKKDE